MARMSHLLVPGLGVWFNLIGADHDPFGPSGTGPFGLLPAATYPVRRGPGDLG